MIFASPHPLNSLPLLFFPGALMGVHPLRWVIVHSLWELFVHPLWEVLVHPLWGVLGGRQVYFVSFGVFGSLGCGAGWLAGWGRWRMGLLWPVVKVCARTRF